MAQEFHFPTNEHIIGALLYMYDQQEQDEKIMKATGHQNGVGFNSIDAPILSSIAQFYLKNKFLTERQIAYCRIALQKYWKQFMDKYDPVVITSIAKQQPKPEPFKKAVLNGETIEISFTYSTQIVEMIKSFEGRSWDKETKMWFCPLRVRSIKRLIEAGFEIDPKITDWYEIKRNEKLPVIDKIPGLRITPYPFQYEGVSYIESKGGRALIGDDMGLGKTAQAIAYLQRHPELRPAVIVCPNSVKEAWFRAVVQWMSNEKVLLLEGKPKSKQSIFTGTIGITGTDMKKKQTTIYITNYNIIANKIITEKHDIGQDTKREDLYTGWVDFIIEESPQVLIVDESHKCKNEKAARTIAVRKLAKYCPKMIALTGTPIVNRPIEFWPILNMIAPKIFRDFMKFAKRYCNASRGRFGWDFKGSSNEQELAEILRETVMIRRMKTEVLTQLPPKVRSVVPLSLDPSSYKKYKTLERKIAEWMNSENSNNKAAALTRIEMLKQEAVTLKLDMMIEWVEDFIDNEKLVLFVDHHTTANAFRKYFSKITKVTEVTGQTKGSCQEQVDLFQNDPESRLFIGSKSAIEALTLTAASNVAFAELFWTPGDHDQAEDRVLRIGQEADNCTAWYLLAADTIEEEIAELLDQKRKVLEAILNGKKVKDIDLLTTLMNRLKEAA